MSVKISGYHTIEEKDITNHCMEGIHRSNIVSPSETMIFKKTIEAIKSQDKFKSRSSNFSVFDALSVIIKRKQHKLRTNQLNILKKVL